ncbi:DUF1189 family protein [Candidatus Woesearchaeota archaeon]|nr:DUF1189 family protein [Candidatus Woesearchaeota archaeon]
MKKVLGFYRTFLQTLKPKNYEDFAESTLKNSFNYYSSLIINAFLVFMIIMIPAAVQMPNTIESYIINDIDTLNFDINIKTNIPILIPKDNPVLLINYQNMTPNQTANVIIDNDVLYAGFLFKKFVKDLEPYRDAKQNSGAVSNFVAFILLLMLPTLLLILFFYLLIKYFIIIILAALIGAILSPIIGYRTKFRYIFNSAIYGISLSIFLDLIFFAVGFSFYKIQFLPLAFYVISGIRKSGMKVDKKMKNKFIEIR